MAKRGRAPFEVLLLGAFCAALALVLALVPVARAASTRYTSPTGTGTTCTQGSPCSINQAFTSPGNGDTIVIEPGTYAVSGSISTGASNLTVEGVAGEARPVLNFSNGQQFVGGEGWTMSGLDIESTGGFSINVVGNVSQMFVEAADAGGDFPICDFPNSSLTDSVCVNTGSGSGAWGVEDAGGITSESLYNDTFYAANAGGDAMLLYQTTTHAGGTDTVTATNVIAVNGAGGHGVFATSAGDPAQITMVDSDYANPGTSGGVDAEVIDGGGNVSTAPGFVDAAAFDFHELATSPTIGVGLLNLSNDGTVDFDGLARSTFGNVDMGAFQYQAPATPAAVPSANTANEGQAITFTGSEVDPNPGAGTVTYSWRFDDGATAPGRVVSHAFETAGPHTATLTVGDGSPYTATATAHVSVPAPSEPAPSISGLGVQLVKVQHHGKKHKPARYGEQITFSLSASASVDATITENLKGKRVHGRCESILARAARRAPCAKSKVVGNATLNGVPGPNTVTLPGTALSKRLGAGSYTLQLMASDSAGDSSPVSVTFRVP